MLRGGGELLSEQSKRWRREPGEWVGELTSCLTAVYDETNLLETNLFGQPTLRLLESPFKLVARANVFLTTLLPG